MFSNNIGVIVTLFRRIRYCSSTKGIVSEKTKVRRREGNVRPKVTKRTSEYQQDTDGNRVQIPSSFLLPRQDRKKIVLFV